MDFLAKWRLKNLKKLLSFMQFLTEMPLNVRFDSLELKVFLTQGSRARKIKNKQSKQK